MPRISRWSPATDAPTRCPASRRMDSTSVRYSSPWLLSVRTLPSASANSRPSNANTPELISRIARCSSVASLCSTISVTAPVAESRTMRP